MNWQPFFFDGPAGRLFAIFHAPAEGKTNLGSVVFVPPFAEEMNQSRRIISLQARLLAEAGVGTLLIDLYGTGDSAGDFVEARWDIWIGDILVGLDWLIDNGQHPIGVWGLRLGALLAMDAAKRHPDRISRTILWQPIIKGQRMLTQFLRLRVAAAMGDKNKSESTASLRNDLAQNGSVEVAGYEIADDLARAMDAASLDHLTPPSGFHVDWFEVASEPGTDLSSPAKRIVDSWASVGVDVRANAVVGEPFWSLRDSVPMSKLWATTVQALAQES